MGIYIVLYSLLFFCAFFDLKKPVGISKKQIVYFFVILFTLFRGLRWETGTDWHQFENVFYQVRWSNIFNHVRYGGDERVLEPGYVFLNLFFRTLTGHYTFFLLATNFFILWTYAKFSFKHASLPIIAFIAIIGAGQFFTVRQSLATAILMFAYNYAVSRSLVKFLVVVFIASLIHGASIIFVPFYFFIRVKLNYVLYVACLIGSIVIFDVLPKVMLFVIDNVGFIGSTSLRKLVVYASQVREEVYGVGRSYFNIMMTFFFLSSYYWVVLKIKEKEKRDTYYGFLNFFLAQTVLLNMFSEMMQELSRLGSFFLFGGPLLMTELVWSGFTSKLRQLKPLFVLLFVLFMYYRFYKMTFMWPEAHFPYKSIFHYL